MQSEYLKKHGFEILLVVAVLAIHIYAAGSDAYNFPNNWFTRDDAYYYFKVAQNITEGHGITFDGVSPTNGYHPLWMLVNIPVFALARFDLILPLRILLVLQGALSAGAAVLIYRIVREAISGPVAVVAASWWAFNPYIHGTMYEYGLETALASFTVPLLVHQLLKFEKAWRSAKPRLGEIAWLGACAALAMFSRLDLVFLALLAGAWIVLRGTPMRVLLPLDLLLAAFAAVEGAILRLGVVDYYSYSKTITAMIAISAVSRLLIYYFMGLYQPVGAKPLLTSLRDTLIAVSAASAVTAAVLLAGRGLLGGIPRTALVYDWLINLGGALLLRGLAWIFRGQQSQAQESPLKRLREGWRMWLAEGVAYYATVGIPLAAYMLFNKLAIGKAMPVSGEIKRWWGAGGSRAYGGAARNPLAFWGIDPGGEFGTWNPFAGGLGALAEKLAAWRGLVRTEEVYLQLALAACLVWLGILLLRRGMARRVVMQAALPLLLAASFAQVLSYNLTGYAAMKEWYWISEPVLALLALSLAAGILICPLEKRLAARTGLWVLAGGTAVLLGWQLAALIALRMPYGAHQPLPGYLDSVRFLEEQTPPGAMIGMTGGGNVGYYIAGDRTIVNMDGLINSPQYLEDLKTGQANRYLQSIGLDYIFANPNILDGVPYKGQFATGLWRERYGGKVLMDFSP